MSQSIRIDESLHEQAKSYAKAERRTIAGQIERSEERRVGKECCR